MNMQTKLVRVLAAGALVLGALGLGGCASTRSGEAPDDSPLKVKDATTPDPAVPAGRVNRTRTRPLSRLRSAATDWPSRVRSEPARTSVASTRRAS